MQLNKQQAKQFADAVQEFLDALDRIALQDASRDLAAHDARSNLGRYLWEFRSAIANDQEEEAVSALFSISGAGSPMIENGVGLDRSPLDTAWKQVKDKAAPLLQWLADQ